ncbi:DUF1642 domain-containing protein [Lactococcus cremoris]|uniref:DUF1642 domain-containing protein n=1 Tax=Lactococcus lactis subsp. cremoris TaxID=1359 RepID=UPI0007B30F23|nr:DUF1642 domain-containing protein [Lactococcus cremoris]KZK10645.1 Phage protein [Lactococcus cremoris]MDU8932071.1 hypothetical protein [Lactococcus cremoris]
MTKFTNRIKPDSTELERYFLSVYTGNLWDALEKIKDWHSPEHIEKEVQMKLLKLQQQALPVVPECVAEWIEILKTKGLKPLKNPETYGETGFTEEKLQNIVFWISEHQEDYMRAWLDGYTVEKPQLFYLKHIDMSETDEHYDYYLSKSPKGNIFHSNIGKGKLPKLKCILKLTQQEIESLHAGSYEQIEVEK